MRFDVFTKFKQAFGIGKLHRKFTVPAFSSQFGDYKKGAAYFVDGSGLAISTSTVGATVRGLTTMTIDAWIKPMGTVKLSGGSYSDSNYWIAHFHSANASVVIDLYLQTDNRLYCLITNGTSTIELTSTHKATLFEWNHVGMTFDNGTNTLQLWVNGQVTSLTQTFNNDFTPGTLPFTLWITPISTSFAKRVYYLDEWCVWNVVKDANYFTGPLKSQLKSLTDTTLKGYLRFTTDFTDSITSDVLASPGGAFSAPTIVTTEQYPYSTGCSWMFGIVDLRTLPSNFSIQGVSKKPSNYSIAVCWVDGVNFYRKFLTTGSNLVTHLPPSFYNKETIIKDNAFLEFWADDKLTSISESGSIDFTTSILEHPKSFKDNSPTTLGSFTLKQNIYSPAPWSSATMNFNQAFPTLNY